MFYSGLNLSPDVIRNAIASTQPVAATQVPAASVGIGGQTTQPVEATQVPASTDWLSLAATLPATIQVYDRDRGYIEIPNPEIDVYRMAAIQDQWMSQPFSPVMNTRYDPATYGAAGDYLRGLDEYAKSLGVTDYNTLNYYPGVDKILPSANAQLNILPEYSIIKEQAPMVPGMALGPTLYSAEEYASRINPAVTAKTPYEQMVEYRLGVPINYGLTGKDVNPYQTFDVRYNTPVALLDLDGNVLASGTGFEAAQKIADQAYNLSRSSKTYTIATADPSTGQWTPVVTDAPNKSALGQFASFALPVIGGMVAGPLGAAAGSAASGVVQGQGIGDILKNAAIAGVTAAGVGELFQATGLDKAIGSIGGQAASTSVDAATQAAIQAGLEAAPITVVGSQLAPVVSGAIGGLTSAQLSNALSGITEATKPQIPSVIEAAVQPPAALEPVPAPAPPVEAPPIVVTGQITPRIEEAVGAIIGGAGIGELSRLGYSQAEIDAAIKEAQKRTDVVEAEKPAIIEQPPVVVPPQPPAPPPVVEPPAIIEQPEIVVEAEKPAVIEQPPVVVPPPVIPTQPAPNIPEGVGPEIVVEAPKKPTIPIPPDILAPDIQTPDISEDLQKIIEETKPDLDKGLSVRDYIRLGLLASDLVKGGASDGGTVFINSGGPLSYTPLNRTAATPTFDPFTYGQDVPGAQQSEFLFFPPQSMKTSAQSTQGGITYQTGPSAEELAAKSAYDTALAGFNAYQDQLAKQVAAKTLTPEAAQTAAQEYASTIGYQTVAPTTTPQLAKGGKVEDSDMHDDMIKHLMAYRSGGGHMGPGKVKGIGSGQEDLIPAWLSDGEYVWSAQDVADLGDGSTDEGVRRLDKMREMVRKQAGRKNVKKIAKPQKGIDSMLKAVGGRV